MEDQYLPTFSNRQVEDTNIMYMIVKTANS